MRNSDPRSSAGSTRDRLERVLSNYYFWDEDGLGERLKVELLDELAAVIPNVAQPQQEPVAWRIKTPTGYVRDIWDNKEEAEREVDGYWRGTIEPLYAQPPAAPVETDALGVIESDRLFAEQILADFGAFEEGITDKEKLAQWIRNVRRASSTPDAPPLQSSSAGNAQEPSRDQLISDIACAETMLSEHIEKFHDFDYEPHQVPEELASLRGIQHHLAGSLINNAGEPVTVNEPQEAAVWEPTEAQVRSACLSYRHDYGLLDVAAQRLMHFHAREWLRAWQKEGAGVDRNEIIERCAVVVDQANREGPYQAIAAASRIRALKTSSTLSRPHGGGE